jgi:hypothetical protein
VHGYLHIESERDGRDVKVFLAAQLINRSDYPVKLIEVSASNPDKKPAGWHAGLEGLPAVVAPQDAHEVRMPIALLRDHRRDVDLQKPLVAWARLSTGEELKGKPVDVLELMGGLRADPDTP